MDKAEIIKKIESVEWYRQGGAVLPYYEAPPWRNAVELYDGLNYFEGVNNYGYFDKTREKKVADRIVSHQLADNSYFSQEIVKPWQELADDQNTFVEQITLDKLTELSAVALFDLYKNFQERRFEIWRTGIYIESFDFWGDQIIQEQLRKHKIEIQSDDLSKLLSPKSQSFLQKEALDIYRLALDYQQGENIKERIQEHTSQYFHIRTSWAEIVRLQESDFQQMVKEAAVWDEADLKQKIKALEEFDEKRARESNALIKRYRLPNELVALFDLFSVMADWRDARKSQAMRINTYAELFLQVFADLSGIELKHLQYLDAFEFNSLGELISLKDNLLERPQGCLLYVSGKGTATWFVGEEANNLHNLLENRLNRSTEIRGVVANKGRAQGRVKIIISRDDFKKMEQGDVLVTQMTRPEYVPILPLASAIVTDEGGITCHAAIVSREMGIPCVIGTQVATSTLKDGDLVEVDAEKGKVRKI